MNPIDDITQMIMEKSDRTLEENIVRNSVHHLAAILVNRRRKQIIMGDNVLLVNYFGLVIAGSNFGKGHISKTLTGLLSKEIYEKNATDQIDAMASGGSSHFGVDTDIKELKRFVTTIVSPNKESTTQGIHKMAEAMSVAGTVGSMNFLNNEFFSTASGEILEQMLEGYDGIFHKPNIKGGDSAKYFDVENLPVNLIGYSAIGPLLNNQKSFQTFSSLMETGWFRRTWMTTDREHIKKAKRPGDYILQPSTIDYLEKNSMAELEVDFTDMEVSIQAMHRFEQYREELINSEHEVEFGEFRDAYKVIRLAGIRAAMEEREEILVEDLEYAMDFERHCHMEASEMLSMKDDFVLAYLKLGKTEMAKTDMIRNGIIKSVMSDKAFSEFLNRVSEYAHTKGDQLISDDSTGVKLYKVKRMNKVDHNLVGLSVSTRLGDGYVYNKDKFSKIASVLSAKGLNYSAGNFKDGKRTKESYIPGQDLIILDVDDGMTMSQAKILFEEYECIIATTRNHQKEKNGKTVDRFRILLVADTVIEMDAETYYNFMINVYGYLGQDFDRSCADASRMYFSNEGAEVWQSEGTKLFDIRPCVPNSKEEQISATIVKRFDGNEGAKAFFALEASKGQRNKMLFRYAMMLKDDGLSISEIQHEVTDLNSNLDDPLSDKEVEATIFKTLSK